MVMAATRNASTARSPGECHGTRCRRRYSPWRLGRGGVGGGISAGGHALADPGVPAIGRCTRPAARPWGAFAAAGGLGGAAGRMPRAALLSIHARVEGTHASTWEDPSLVQTWGPRHDVFVVALRDLAIFTLGILPDDGSSRRRAEELAARLHAFVGGARTSPGEAGRALGVHPGSFRYAAPTGTVLIRWDGARRPAVWTVPPPAVDPVDARLELARRYLHIYGPTTPETFARWAGLHPRHGVAAF